MSLVAQTNDYSNQAEDNTYDAAPAPEMIGADCCKVLRVAAALLQLHCYFLITDGECRLYDQLLTH